MIASAETGQNEQRTNLPSLPDRPSSVSSVRYRRTNPFWGQLVADRQHARARGHSAQDITGNERGSGSESGRAKRRHHAGGSGANHRNIDARGDRRSHGDHFPGGLAAGLVRFG